MTAKISGDGSIFLTERASAETDAAGNIQIWNKNTAGGQLYVTDDLGADHVKLASTTEVAATKVTTRNESSLQLVALQ